MGTTERIVAAQPPTLGPVDPRVAGSDCDSGQRAALPRPSSRRRAPRATGLPVTRSRHGR